MRDFIKFWINQLACPHVIFKSREYLYEVMKATGCSQSAEFRFIWFIHLRKSENSSFQPESKQETITHKLLTPSQLNSEWSSRNYNARGWQRKQHQHISFLKRTEKKFPAFNEFFESWCYGTEFKDRSIKVNDGGIGVGGLYIWLEISSCPAKDVILKMDVT